MAWGRLALLQAAGEDDATLQQMAAVFGYEVLPDDGGSITQELGHPGFQVGTATSQKTADAQADTSLPRLPARFLRVNRIVRHNDEGHSQKPAYLNDPAMRLVAGSATKGTYSFAQPRLLLPMSRLIPFLLNSLGQQKAGSQLDQRHLARQLAQGKAIHRLPHLPRQRWPQRLQVIADTSTRLEPYWGDFAFIIGQLKKLLGEESVEAIHFDEDRLGSGLPMCSRWPVQDNVGWYSWRIPPADVPVLVLGDLGVDDRQGSARIHWQRLARRLRSHPAPLLALSPTARSPVNKSLCRQFRPNPLNDVYGLPRHPTGNGFVLGGIAGGNLDDILALLSPLPLIDAGLLRRLRDGLEWGGSELESAIWNHPDMRQTGLGIRLREQVAEHYRQQYQQHFAGTPQAERLWQIVQEHHAPAHEGLRQLEKLNQCVLENCDDHAVVQDYLKRLCATVAQGGNSRLQRKALMMQCRTILASRPECIWESALGDRAYDLYALAYEDEIRAGQWPNMLEEGFDPARLQWVLDAKARGETVQWLVVQTNDQGRFSLRPHNPDQPVNTPVARLEALKQIPSVLHFPLKPPMPLEEGAEFEIPDKGVVAIHSASHRIELEAITKPSWADSIGQDTQGLFVEHHCLGNHYRSYWQVPDIAGASGYWQGFSPDKNDIDDYTCYANLCAIPHLPVSWQQVLSREFTQPYWQVLLEFLANEQAAGKTLLPEAGKCFNALQVTPLDQVKVVILGQDPYPTRGFAHGLAFSVLPEVTPLPRSLQNIYRELREDVGVDNSHTGYLQAWAEQGVLLLNTVLSVVEGQAGSHQNCGWEVFTDAVIRVVNVQPNPVVFVLWGGHAQKKAALIDTSKHLVIQSAHPSPLSAQRGFFGSKPFSRINAFLQQHGRNVINWQLEPLFIGNREQTG